MMPTSNELKFYESTTNLKAALKRSYGKTPSSRVTRHISVCIQQGRQFFEIASPSPIQIQPLLIFYGVLNFAKAIILARKFTTIETISQTHGLSDTSDQNAKIEDLNLRIQKRGVFQQFNDAVAPLGRINYYDYNSMPQSIPKPFDSIEKLADTDINIREILSRIPGLHSVYKNTFNTDPANWPIDFHHQLSDVQLRIDDQNLFQDRDGLQQLVKNWRLRFPFLEQWCFCEGVHAWGHTILFFYNIEKPQGGEFQNLVHGNNGFSLPNEIRSPNHIEFESIIPPLAGGINNGHPVAIQPYNEVALSEYSLEFCGCFLLSSLVRYRPQTWQHALSHASSPELPADDRAVSLIEQFLQTVASDFTQLVTFSISLTK